jgi:hypothetical protein
MTFQASSEGRKIYWPIRVLGSKAIYHNIQYSLLSLIVCQNSYSIREYSDTVHSWIMQEVVLGVVKSFLLSLGRIVGLV